MVTTRPKLREIPLASVWPIREKGVYATMSIGQWDGILQGAYNAGFVLLELDDDENPVKAYQRPEVGVN